MESARERCVKEDDGERCVGVCKSSGHATGSRGFQTPAANRASHNDTEALNIYFLFRLRSWLYISISFIDCCGSYIYTSVAAP